MRALITRKIMRFFSPFWLLQQKTMIRSRMTSSVAIYLFGYVETSTIPSAWSRIFVLPFS